MVSSTPPAVIYPRERPGTHCTGGCVGPSAGLDERKISPHRDSIPGPSSPQSVAIPTELSRPTISNYNTNNLLVQTQTSDFHRQDKLLY
jgi:hypothetical protein